MTEINASMVKDLREKTGAGMMDCKKALVGCNGNMEEAVDWLRKKGLAAAGKRSGRVASEGVIVIATAPNKAIVLELNAETDFVTKNDKFQALARNLAAEALKHDIESMETLLTRESPYDNSKTVQEEIVEHIATIGENLTLRRLDYVSLNSGVIGSYIHSSVAEGMGKIGVLVLLESDSVSEEVKTLAKQIAMHVAAAKPESLNIEQLDQALIEKEKSIFAEQALASGKPAAVVEKMVEGRMRKFYEEVVLLEQAYAIDNKIKISQMIADVAKKVGSQIKVTKFIRYGLGEGIEKQESNFAAEVAAMAG
ncbi:MAG: translation elongation factor Ts [Candidatus Midichloria mitochondrii]|uniref:Elongation factor Ts n=1 Tax=Midichloria mitochondrii (strain IricVA) TaxID=696127 RepID=F7XWA5_MIDMI|nr:translation elongation factor Ts [Candidatus Midichloria mitochondrii]AEI88954.1 elongation factor Ts [Candidatus Midichloria mitochondrii IricVA]MDJ1256839.1 translation elongation factor Ts [Candidatus Midichloria mitochondrii]MDJ1288572.1 translation elongation factor Ts [Candidatus Midichloria mitochondrii]MDJ1299398.1 translation elongation factor Ts [Candidatus Midichloria mitochondrii]MDJ1313541.1 translation elongation factor Ts [Candidatus Midichloria mitochondrii]